MRILRGESVLAFRAGDFELLRKKMLEDAPLETACFVLARVTEAETRMRLIATEIISLTAGDYMSRTETFLEIQASALANAAKRARLENLTLILAHTHPIRGVVGPSPTDVKGESAWVPAVRRRILDKLPGRLIIGRESAHAALLGPDGERVLRVVEVGDRLITVTGNTNSDATSDGRNDRQVLAFGREGQTELEALHVCVVGCGGTGSVVLQQLAFLGVREFTLIDPDVVEESNLNRVVGATPQDIGRPKVDVASDAIKEVQPTATTTSIRGDVCEAAVARKVLSSDFFFCCTDSEGSRAVLNQLAYQYLLPGIDLGVVIRVREGQITHINGRVQMLTFGQACLLCGDVLDPEQVRRDLLTEEARASDRYIDGAQVAQPAVISINSATASLAVTMMLSAVTGVPVGTRNQRIRFERGAVGGVSVAARELCPICSEFGALGRADSFAVPGRR